MRQLLKKPIHISVAITSNIDCRMVTVHPCKHSDVMKNFVDEAKKHGKKIKSHQALMIFLKFMSSVMPTVCFDTSVDIEI